MLEAWSSIPVLDCNKKTFLSYTFVLYPRLSSIGK
jgi:hypothetical protein